MSAHSGPSDLRRVVGVGDLSIAIEVEFPEPALQRQIGDLYGLYPQHGPDALPDLTITLRRQNRRPTLFRHEIRVLANGHAPYPSVPVRWAVPVIEASINWFVWRYVARVLLIHAAVIERDGRTVLLPGPSGAGKSTLCAALLARGWRLLTDEIAMVRPQDGRLQPHPRPISLKDGAIDIVAGMLPDAHFSERFAHATKGAIAFMRPPTRSIEMAGETATPAVVAFPRYRPGSGLELARIEKAQAFMRLIESSANYLMLLETGFETLANLVESCDHYSLVYESLEDAVAVIERLEPASKGIEQVA